MDISCLFCIIPLSLGELAHNCGFLVGLLITVPHFHPTSTNPWGHRHVHESTLPSPWLWWIAPNCAHCISGAIQSASLGFYIVSKRRALSYLWSAKIRWYKPCSVYSHSPSPTTWQNPIFGRKEWDNPERETTGERVRGVEWGVGQHEWINKNDGPSS